MAEITSTAAETENSNVAAERNFNITSYARAQDKMIATNDNAYNVNTWSNYHQRLTFTREYTPEDIDAIIERGSLEAQQKLSRHYFYKDGYYKQIIIHSNCNNSYFIIVSFCFYICVFQCIFSVFINI